MYDHIGTAFYQGSSQLQLRNDRTKFQQKSCEQALFVEQSATDKESSEGRLRQHWQRNA